MSRSIKKGPFVKESLLNKIEEMNKAGEKKAILQYTPKDAAVVINKLLKSAVANAENNFNLDRNRLYVAEAHTGAGPTLKRFRPHAQGRAFRILKRTSHITIVVKERA